MRGDFEGRRRATEALCCAVQGRVEKEDHLLLAVTTLSNYSQLNLNSVAPGS
jgi:hypothetical protein